MNKRAFITAIIGAAVSVPIVKNLFFTRTVNPNPEYTFSALIDTFIPADQFPGALDLGIDIELMNKIQINHEYWSKIVQHLHSIEAICEQVHKIKFKDASLELRTKLISTLLANDSQLELHLQLITLKNQTFSRFYSTQPAFDMLAYRPPSQGGYPDYDQPL